MDDVTIYNFIFKARIRGTVQILARFSNATLPHRHQFVVAYTGSLPPFNCFCGISERPCRNCSPYIKRGVIFTILRAKLTCRNTILWLPEKPPLVTGRTVLSVHWKGVLNLAATYQG